MAILKATILTEMQNRTGRTDVTNIDVELASVLLDMSSAYPFLHKSGSLTLTANVATASLPSDYRKDEGIIGLDPVAFADYLALAAAGTAAGTPTAYAISGKTAYFYPTPASNTTKTLYYSYDANDVNAIAFSDEFNEAIIEGVCYKVYERKSMGNDPAAMVHQQEYQRLLTNLVARYKV